jgi:hypothetical protein
VQPYSIPVKSVIQLQDGRYLGVGKNDNSLYIKDKINDRWDGLNLQVEAKPACHTDANSLVRGQTVYTGCGYTYASESARNTECGPGGTSKWIGDGQSGLIKPDPNTCCVLSIVQLNNGTLIGVGTNNYLYKKEKLADNWKQIKCPVSCCVTSVSKLLDGYTIVAVGTDGYIYTRQEDKEWTLVDRSMKMSATTQLKDGTILGLDQNGSYFRK